MSANIAGDLPIFTLRINDVHSFTHHKFLIGNLPRFFPTKHLCYMVLLAKYLQIKQLLNTTYNYYVPANSMSF